MPMAAARRRNSAPQRSTAALSSVGDLVLAFLDVRLRGADGDRIERALQRHPALQRHEPTRMKAWTGR